MDESAKSTVQRMLDLFNRDFGEGDGEIQPDMRELWAAEPAITPFRSLLEGTVYRGPGALEEFAAASRESWTRVRFEAGQLRELGPGHVLLIAELVASGRQSGLETRMPIAMLFTVEEGQIVEGHAYATETDALAAVKA